MRLFGELVFKDIYFFFDFLVVFLLDIFSTSIRSFSICSRRVAWFMLRCWILSLRSENASLSMSMSFFTWPKLADTFLSIWFVDFSIILERFNIYKVL